MPKSLAQLSQDLRRLPRVVALKIAEACAPRITELASKSFEQSETPYGVPWAPGAEGQTVTLRKTGVLAKQIRYVAIGTKLRVALGTRYAKYQIGKRPVFPRQDAALPDDYRAVIERTAADVVKAEMSRK
jgi:hypothetical protein